VDDRPDSEIEPFWGHWTRRDDDMDPPPEAEAKPQPRAGAEPAQRGNWLSSRWFGGCLAAAAALGLGLGIWALLVPGPTQLVRFVNTAGPPTSTVTRYVTQRVTHVVPRPAPAPPPVTEWATAPAPPPATLTVTPRGATVTVRVPAPVTVRVPVTVTVTAAPTGFP
jgi:hypothetical protein